MNREQEDKKWMRNALKLAKRAWGCTSPNPMVGAVVVREGRLVGSGYHKCAGDAHAEVNALHDAGTRAKGAALYVTLEPCSTFGRTPPCTQAIIDAGIKKVVIGVKDPNPKHAGNAVKILEKTGINVCVGIEVERCKKLNEAFFKWIVTGKPFVLLKMAMTLDGKIATAQGQSQWITGPVARQRVQKLRQWSDAILVGGETVRKDKPSLTVRCKKNWKQPRRLVATRRLSEHELKDLLPPGNDPEPIDVSGRREWGYLLKKLGEQEVTALLIEGGGKLAADALNAGMVDKVEFHIAPKILGGEGSRPVIAGSNPESLADALSLVEVSTRKLGEDIAITGYLR